MWQWFQDESKSVGHVCYMQCNKTIGTHPTDQPSNATFFSPETTSHYKLCIMR